MARGGGPTDQDELVVTAAILYYQQDRSQEQIARELGVSRPTVSRLLARAREKGYVQIAIVPPSLDTALARTLREGLGLRSVHIASGVADGADPGPVLSHQVDLALVEADLQAGDVLLVSWGRAMHSLGRCPRPPRPGVVVAPALGGNDSDRPWFQPNEVARLWAQALQGVPRYLHAPALVSTTLLRSLQAESTIRAVLDLWDCAKVSVVGIGAWPKPDPSYTAAGFPVDDPAIRSAAGDEAGRSYNEDGRMVDFPSRGALLGISADQLRQVPRSIGVAADRSKAKAVVGAARAGLIDTLVTDLGTARAVAERMASPAALTGGRPCHW
jgi:DNA-binding transcriptional regulator LsrR (DeoR family)